MLTYCGKLASDVNRARDVDMNTIQPWFKRYDSQWNDAQVSQSVHSYFHFMTNLKNRSAMRTWGLMLSFIPYG